MCQEADCGLCAKREAFEGIFVADTPETFVCSFCLPTTNIDIGDVKVEVWEENSEGWLGPIECRICGEEIPVVLGYPAED